MRVSRRPMWSTVQRRYFTVVGIALCMPVVAAQRPQLAKGDGSTAQQPSAISGTVVDGDTRAAIPNAVVYLSGGLYATVLTDAKGRFAFTGLPPGRYGVGAEKLGYFSGLLGDPSPRVMDEVFANGAREVTKRLILREGEWLSDATIAIWRPGAIDGVVRDERGEPLVGRYVRVLAAQQSRFFAPFAVVAAGTTDDRGIFRIGRVPPGEYFVGMHGAESDFSLAPTRGALVYPPTYFPSTGLLKEAMPVMVTSGRTTSGIELTVSRGAGYTVGGRVEGPAETRASPRLVLANADDVFAGTTSHIARAQVNPDGTFLFPPVAQGHYILTTTAGQPGPEIFPPPPSSFAGGPTPWELPRWGSRELSDYVARIAVDVGDRDVTDLVVPLTKGVTLSGVIRSDRPDDGTVRFPGVMMAEPLQALPGIFVRSSNLIGGSGADGHKPFEIRGLAPGLYRLTNSDDSPVIASITVGGVDISGRVLDLSAGTDLTDIQVVFTVSPKVTGQVRHAAPLPKPDVIVAYFPTDSELRRPGSGSARLGFVNMRRDASYETERPFPPGRYSSIAHV